MDKEAIKVLLVDDHPLVLESLSTLLEPHFAVVGRVQDARDIVRHADEYRPDVILMDACMPGTSGFEATRAIKTHLPKVKVIVVTMLTEATSISEAFRSGANGYLLKQSASEELHEAIHTVLASKRFLSQKIPAEVRESLEHEWLGSADYSGYLTEREREVLVLLSQGGSAKQIAKQLDISIKTVEFHRANITRKLGVHTISELTKFALAHGLTSL